MLSKTSRIQYPNWNYADTILQDYVRRKIDTVEKIQADEIGFKKSKAEYKQGGGFLNEQRRI